MNLYSLTFLYMFLPCSVAAYHLTPKRGKNAILLLISLAFYTLAEPKYLVLLVGSVLFDYAACLMMEYCGGRTALCRGLMAFVISKNLLLVAFLSSLTRNRELWRPLGLMVCLVTSLGYVLDVYLGRCECEHNLIDFGLFCLLFCKLPAGPLVRWEELRGQLKERRASLSQISDGIVMYIQGLAKKVLIGSGMTALYDQLRILDQSLLSAWLMTAALAFAVYFNLSALCDMARGLGRLFSLELPRNFYYPYQARSVTDFVSRFNMTVTDFFSVYLTPSASVGAQRGRTMVLHLFVLTCIWGLWFGFRVNFIIWGLYFVLFQLLESLGMGKLLQRVPTLLARVYTFAVVLVSFVIFAGNNVSQSLYYIGAMLGMRQTYTSQAMYLASSNYMLLIVAAVLSTSLANMLLRRLRGKVPVFSTLCSLALNLTLVVLSTAFLLIQ